MPARVKLKKVGGISYMNWMLRLNSIQHAETYQGLGMCESLPAGLGLNASDDYTWDCAWPPEVDGVIFWLSP